MKMNRRKIWIGFTLIELLVVIAIIAILAAMLLPALMRVKRVAKVFQARTDLAAFVTACDAYEREYGRPPLVPAASNFGGDATFGPGAGSDTNRNASVCAVLADAESFPGGSATPNAGHRFNPRRHSFFAYKPSPDGQWIDPWGVPYTVTLDADMDGRCIDGLYGMTPVADESLFRDMRAGGEVRYFLGSVMAWSAGPDNVSSPLDKAGAGANKDNVVSWRSK
jgi:prepilin-type N-terminal cleavage/methylation domain-containing protein